MVVDMSQDSDSDELSDGEDSDHGPENLVWLYPEQIVMTESLNTRPVYHDIFNQLSDSGMFAEEIINYIHRMVERCYDIEAAGQVGRVPRDLPDRCSVCMAPSGTCPIPCRWRPNYSRACSRRCDEQIRTNVRRTCPMWDIFEVVDPDLNPELFPPHELGRLINPETGRPYDPIGDTVYPRPLDFIDRPADYQHLSDMMPDRQYGDRNEDHRRAMTELQTNLNNGNRQYLDAMRRTGTPPNGYFSGFEINFGPMTGHGHAVSHSKLRSMSHSQSSSIIEFEWDSD